MITYWSFIAFLLVAASFVISFAVFSSQEFTNLVLVNSYTRAPDIDERIPTAKGYLVTMTIATLFFMFVYVMISNII